MRNVLLLVCSEGFVSSPLLWVCVPRCRFLFWLGFGLHDELALVRLNSDDRTKTSPCFGSHPLKIDKHIADLDPTDNDRSVARYMLILTAPLWPSVFLQNYATYAVLWPQKVPFQSSIALFYLVLETGHNFLINCFRSKNG